MIEREGHVRVNRLRDRRHVCLEFVGRKVQRVGADRDGVGGGAGDVVARIGDDALEVLEVRFVGGEGLEDAGHVWT